MNFELVNKVEPKLKKKDNLLLWDSHFENRDKNIVSILSEVESNSHAYRNQFYEFLFEISKKKINNSTLEKYLEIEQGLSFFWFSNLGQRDNYYAYPVIDDLLKIFALLKIIEKRKITEVHLNLAVNPKIFNQIIEVLIAKGVKVNFLKKLKPKNKRDISFLFISTVYIFYAFALRFNLIKNKKNNSKIALFDFLVDKKKTSYSKYFTVLPDLIKRNDLSFTHSHLFYKKDFKSLFHSDFNFLFKKDHIVDREISFNIMFRVIKNYILLINKRKKLKGKTNLFKSSFHKVDFKTLLFKDFIDSLIEKDIIKNLMYHEIIKKYIKKNSSLSTAIYPLENQPWESILVHNWKKLKNKNIYGMIHTTVRYWDLKMYYGKNYKKIENILPTKILSNSPISTENLSLGGYEKNLLLNVEALRYLGLRKENNIVDQENKILICGDFNKKINNQLLDLNSRLSKIREVDFLPHPTISKSISTANVVDGKLIDLIKKYNIVITSSMSSSAVDAYENLKIVYQLTEQGALNFTALRGFEDVFIFDNIEELILSIKNKEYYIGLRKENYFYDDSRLDKWNDFLNIFN